MHASSPAAPAVCLHPACTWAVVCFQAPCRLLSSALSSADIARVVCSADVPLLATVVTDQWDKGVGRENGGELLKKWRGKDLPNGATRHRTNRMRRLIPVLVKKAECVKIGWRKSAKQTDSVVREKNQISHRIFLQVKVNSWTNSKISENLVRSIANFSWKTWTISTTNERLPLKTVPWNKLTDFWIKVAGQIVELHIICKKYQLLPQRPKSFAEKTQKR